MVIRTALCLTALISTAFAAPRPTAEQLAADARALEPLFSGAPFSVAPRWQDRGAWSTAAKNGKTDTASIIRRAENLLEKALPPWPEEAYYDFTTNGNRDRYQNLNTARHRHADSLIQAELLEGKGRFIPAIARALEAFCADATWVLPAHDGNLANVKQQSITIDLASSAFGWRLATVAAQFGAALPAGTREKVIAAVRARVVNPYLAMLDKHHFNNWWVLNNANWNAVCHAGVVGATLALPGVTAAEKSRVVASARAHVRIFLSGFDADGWCGEGVAYWNYGFGNFVNLAETVRAATGGKEDWLLWPEARLPARSAPSCLIQGQIYPAFADCSADVKADADLIAWLNARLGWQLKNTPLPWPKNPAAFPEGALLRPDRIPAAVKADPLAIDSARSWFPDAEVLIERGKGLSAAIKGGHNGVPHNHNDAGSYMIVQGGIPVLTDAGGETYTARTFSARRYESDLLNSYGHPVPYPAKTLQKPGAKHAAKIIKTDFTRASDLLLLDLAPAYGSERIETLTRAFTWDSARPKVVIEDAFAFTGAPDSFETALITFGSAELASPDTLSVTWRGQTLTVKIEASAPWAFTQSDLASTPTGHAKGPVHRLALTLKEPARKGWIRMTIEGSPQ